MMKLESIDQVIEALGGLAAVKTLTRREYISAVYNWRTRKAFPSNTYATMTDALRQAGHEAPRSLWRMPESPPSVPDEPESISAEAAE